MFKKTVFSFLKTFTPSWTLLYSSVKDTFRSLSLRTQLLLILILLLVVSVSSLTIIYARTEGQIIEKVTDNIDDITTAIQISVEELTYRGEGNQRLKGYVDMLNEKGIKEISILSDKSEVIASSDPKKIGTRQKIQEKRHARKKNLIIKARLGEESSRENQRPYNVIMPVQIKGQNIGYIHINMVLDDYKLIQRKNHLRRILSTVFAFSIGIIFSLLIAEKYTEPIKKIAQASKRIAEGELAKIRSNNRKDEIGVLVKSYNEMVDKLNERKELEEKLKKTEQLSLIGQLSSGIAHEIRNPLNFLSLSIGHIREWVTEEKQDDREEVVKLLDNLTKEIYKVNDLIHNFLFLGKPISLKKEWIMPETLFQEAVYLVKDKVRSGIELEVISRDMGQPIQCDREYIRICIINLILNSVQAMEHDGRVTIEYSKEDSFSCISVKDTGVGIDKDQMEKIFEPYFSAKRFGMGLGLAITKRFVEAHGGTISIESKIGKGTTIMITVPQYET
ncbi:MAG: HAMP domain-containing protein [Syntrophobacterales bacterium]|jgi:signal transduction histidine kinase|nr:HAMP domain-containing protein [Syntrophobacterales bacterium]